MTRNLPGLIRELIGTRSFEQLAEDCNGQPSKHRLYSMVREPLKQFPSVESIQGLAQGLHVHPNTVIMACAESLGLADCEDKGPALVLPESARELTASQKSIVVSTVIEFAKANIRARQDDA
ncbi:hypothetical protein [Nesterenkonia flava]|uniref:Transcriptional regulator n=1 Tax=Nesterenkonia flava TaxID=469799 RepID=A0ABU1FWA9_9MICC|nr:hypothetical protein [Nesterenkonia flava]MDR5712964.1 hypothetical protein [Nesterenkonia flava]